MPPKSSKRKEDKRSASKKDDDKMPPPAEAPSSDGIQRKAEEIVMMASPTLQTPLTFANIKRRTLLSRPPSATPQGDGFDCDFTDSASDAHAVIAQHITRPRPPSGSGIEALLEYNKEWSKHIHDADPGFFKQLAEVQNPQYLWIGCSDSRVPANQVVGLVPGEVFVHRNVGNVVAHADLNCLSVIQFAVEILKVEHIIVCGHYNCGCVKAAHEELRLGLVDNWVRHVVDVKRKYSKELKDLPEESDVLSALCELNAIAQMANVVDTHTMQDYWKRDDVQKVSVHGWCYGLHDGIVNPLLTVTKGDDLVEKVDDAVQKMRLRYNKKTTAGGSG